jgi:glycosyltransferase involved in cell wall biosynthesis
MTAMSELRSPLVSVVMPYFNVAAFLAESIESVRAQRYQNWELLLCDDGGTDGSREIAERYASVDPARIRILEHEDRANRGASATRNLGLRAARGDIISLLDADDVWFPNTLEEQVALLRAHPEADMVYGLAQHWYLWSGTPGSAGRDHIPPAGLASNTLLAPRELITRLLRREIRAPHTCSTAIRADAVRRAGGFVEELRRVYTDQAFFARLSIVSPILFVERCWARYRIHPSSSYATARRTGKGREARALFLEWLDGYLREDPARSDRALRIALDASRRRVRHPRLFAVIDRTRRAVRRAIARVTGRQRDRARSSSNSAS